MAFKPPDKDDAVVEYKINSYQRDAARTLLPTRTLTHDTLALVCLGLTGEAGEVADMAKKIIGHRHPFDADKVIEELGDVLWYISAFCTLMNVPLEEVARRNIEKLWRRYPDGFDPERSINRDK